MSLSKVLKVQGGERLNGTIRISGAKNAILPLMAASVLTKRPVVFNNVPNISDVDAMVKLLQSYGVDVYRLPAENKLRVIARNVRSYPTGPHEKIGQTFRASLVLLGPLLVRCGEALVYRSGGDKIARGGRGDDFHITKLQGLGADVKVTEFEGSSAIDARIPQGRLVGTDIVFPKFTVGATQNIMMAACAALGTTTIEEASMEPETKDLVKMLQNMGAMITIDQPERKITIHGQPIDNFSSVSSTINHTVIPDRIEAGTYAIAAVITGGKISLELGAEVSNNEILNLLEAEFWRLLASGVEITRTSPGNILVESRSNQINAVSVKTKPFPGFPTDMHPQWAALMCFSNGQCWIKENIFDYRFKYVEELQKMGLNIQRQTDKEVVIDGRIVDRQSLKHSPELNWYNNDVEATDIRAGAALVLAALAKNEITVIRGVKEIERGYENIVRKLQSCGAQMFL